jgi:hypothetical protein
VDENGQVQEKEPELSSKAGKSYGRGLHGQNVININRQDGLVKINLGSRQSHVGEVVKYKSDQYALNNNSHLQQHSVGLSQVRSPNSSYNDGGV